MKFVELFEGATPKLPGAVSGIKVMTPQQFVAQYDDASEEKIDEMSSEELDKMSPEELAQFTHNARNDKSKIDPNTIDQAYGKSISIMFPDTDKRSKQSTNHKPQNVNEGIIGNVYNKLKSMVLKVLGKKIIKNPADQVAFQRMMSKVTGPLDTTQYAKLWQDYKNNKHYYVRLPMLQDMDNNEHMYLWSNSISQYVMDKFPNASTEALLQTVEGITQLAVEEFKQNYRDLDEADMNRRGFLKGAAAATAAGLAGCATPSRDTNSDVSTLTGDDVRQRMLRYNDVEELAEVIYNKMVARQRNPSPAMKEGFRTMAEMKAKAIVYKYPPGEFQKAKKHEYQQLGLNEATKLPAQSREFGDDEFQDYMNRIVGKPDIDTKTGKVKVGKTRISKRTGKELPGKEKYISGKVKSDKYKMPYIHRDSVIKYYSENGKRYDEDQIKQALAQRPKNILKQNEKMKHSNGELEQFFNVGFAALTGVALDEETNKLIIVNTCPGAGSCKVDCFAMKGGKVQFEGPWLSDGRILTYLLNDPQGFFSKLSNEISKEEALGDKGGYEVTIRWHDAGDFFSPEYLELALDMASKHPGVKFYAYTKMADAALAKKPGNFIINWSEGAHTSQEKQVKKQDSELKTTKNSRIVPDEIFQDLLVKDEKKNLVKGPEGQWQVIPNKLHELKHRLAKAYGLSANSILSYDEYMAKRKSIPQGMQYNVIVAPGEGDISANDLGILSTLLLKH